MNGHIDESEAILFEMIRRLSLDLPLLAQLDKDFYESPRIARDKVRALREEALSAMRAFQAQPPAFHQMAKGLKPWDPERCLASLVAVCDDALAHDAEIECLSD